jgi:hypothetical protein
MRPTAKLQDPAQHFGPFDPVQRSFSAQSAIEASIKIFREEFAMRRFDHFHVSCGHLKNRQPAAGERPPLRALPFGISRAAEHCNMSGIGLGHIAEV